MIDRRERILSIINYLQTMLEKDRRREKVEIASCDYGIPDEFPSSGIEWQDFPDTGDVPLIADMSSDMLSRPVDVSRFAMIYGGVQKNLGPAGAVFIIMRHDMLDKRNAGLTAYMDYAKHAKDRGLYNTPPVFSIWAVGLVLKWIKKNGGVQGMQESAAVKSGYIYEAIDSSSGFYRSPVDARYRSKMNVVFRTPSEELDAAFVKAAAAEQLTGLKGHRLVGGIRASIYNAMPLAGVEKLIAFMDDFASKNA